MGVENPGGSRIQKKHFVRQQCERREGRNWEEGERRGRGKRRRRKEEEEGKEEEEEEEREDKESQVIIPPSLAKSASIWRGL